MLTLNHFLSLSALLFAVGLYGVLTRRNLIAILIAIEVMLNAVLINFVAFGRYGDNAQGDLFALYVIAVAAAEVAVGLAIFLNVFRANGWVMVDVLRRMKG
ncbi:MAG: NADH-quinone oxidoreductase subunit NuoK [Deinococcota bacterium]|jgi:NADH:ubiquinone oxidoreductase subunit K|nr:NADH-quinone oxidoreductase subunit NuoK [Deinococcota bacterium]